METGNRTLAISDFMSLFSGNTFEFGQHTYGEIIPGQKEKGGKSWTVTDRHLTMADYEGHIDGKTGIGVVPITRENRVKFSVIDIDLYGNGQEQRVINAVQRADCPLVPFRSKSGGYHLYLFFTEFIPASVARKYIDKFIRLYGIDILCTKGKEGPEIFPKQLTLQKGQVGNWINLPYWRGNKSTQRMIYKGRDLSFEEALLVIKSEKVTSEKQIAAYFEGAQLADAPPCLQTVQYLGGPDNNRNNFLFSLGVYYQKRNEDTFEQDLFCANNNLADPLTARELEGTIIQSIRKKGYGYKCKDEPCATFCKKSECKARPFGIGEGGCISELDFGAMTQIKTDPPYYEWEINGKKLRFNDEDEILNQTAFRRACMRVLHYAPYKLKDAEWMKIINNTLGAMSETEIDHTSDTSQGAMLRSLFSEFILDRPLAQTRDQIVMGRVFFNAEDKRYYFRMRDLVDYIYIQKAFKFYDPKALHGKIRDIGCQETRIRIGEKQLRMTSISDSYFTERDEHRPERMPDVDFTNDDATPAGDF